MENNEPARGTLIAGKYRVERTLGEGGMGVVVEATHAQLGSRVAVKLLRGPPSVEAMARFQREARIAAQLTSEHIARVSDMGQTKHGNLFLVMELLEGHDLATELIQRGLLPVAEAVDLMLQACEALSEAHLVGLVHRDVKPANLFLARRTRGRPPILKVLDFGLSKADSGVHGAELTQTASQFGTPQYMSPEQVRSTKHVDARSDQHALGLVLYELITGVPAYDGISPAAVAVSIATAPPPHARERRGDVPRELDQAICRALAKDPRDRFADLTGFAEAIAPFGGPNAPALLQAITAVPSSRRLVAAHAGAPIVRATVSDIPPPDSPLPLPTTRRPPRPEPPGVPEADEATTLDAGPSGIPKIFDPADDDEAPTRRVEVDVPDLTAPSSDDPVYGMLTSRYHAPGAGRGARAPLPAAGAPPPDTRADDLPAQPTNVSLPRGAAPQPHGAPPGPVPIQVYPVAPQMIAAPPAPPIPQSAVITAARPSPLARKKSTPSPAATFALVALLFMLAAGLGIVVTLWWMNRGPFAR